MLAAASKFAAFHVCRHFDAVPLASNHAGAWINFAHQWRTLHSFVSATADIGSMMFNATD